MAKGSPTATLLISFSSAENAEQYFSQELCRDNAKREGKRYKKLARGQRRRSENAPAKIYKSYLNGAHGCHYQ